MTGIPDVQSSVPDTIKDKLENDANSRQSPSRLSPAPDPVVAQAGHSPAQLSHDDSLPHQLATPIKIEDLKLELMVNLLRIYCKVNVRTADKSIPDFSTK